MNAGCDAVYMGGSRFVPEHMLIADEDTLIRAIEKLILEIKDSI